MILWWSFNFGRQWNPSCETTVEMGTEYCSTVVVVFSSGWSFGGESGAVHTADCPPVFVGGKLVQSQRKVGRVNGTWGGGWGDAVLQNGAVVSLGEGGLTSGVPLQALVWSFKPCLYLFSWNWTFTCTGTCNF